MIGRSNHLTRHAEPFEYALRTKMADVGASPHFSQMKLFNAPRHHRLRRLRGEALSPPRTSDRITDHCSARFSFYFKIHRSDHTAAQHDSKRRRALPWL